MGGWLGRRGKAFEMGQPEWRPRLYCLQRGARPGCPADSDVHQIGRFP